MKNPATRTEDTMQAKDLTRGMPVTTIRGEKVVRASSAFGHLWRVAFTDGSLLICQPVSEFPLVKAEEILPPT